MSQIHSVVECNFQNRNIRRIHLCDCHVYFTKLLDISYDIILFLLYSLKYVIHIDHNNIYEHTKFMTVTKSKPIIYHIMFLPIGYTYIMLMLNDVSPLRERDFIRNQDVHGNNRQLVNTLYNTCRNFHGREKI